MCSVDGKATGQEGGKKLFDTLNNNSHTKTKNIFSPFLVAFRYLRVQGKKKLHT